MCLFVCLFVENGCKKNLASKAPNQFPAYLVFSQTISTCIRRSQLAAAVSSSCINYISVGELPENCSPSPSAVRHTPFLPRVLSPSVSGHTPAFLD